ncbi:hypothetical protein NSE01_17300 [Novosphingobium sediminis]|uniref:Uncharacterized protein n=1 Tax=Novosphingobium sediminis TaxID=707214 RepID=A0A512AJL7_9SPHN|nr:hypothetical protein [Novosphingobium sediminis]GEN99897.1 hypothetical protein NSE01_17300 [Novosphingobium sediminis]
MWLDLFVSPSPIERKSEAGGMAHPRVRISPSERMLRALMALAGPHAELMEHSEAPWASVTFAGTRHSIVLHYQGWEACDAAEELMAALPEHEFTIPRTLVADAAVVRLDQNLLPEPSMTLELALLLLDDA